MWYIRETRRSQLHLHHGPLCTEPVPQQRGLKQGCSCSPMLFRWCLQDALQDCRAEWAVCGYGVPIDGRRVTHLVWADDTWLVATSQEVLAAMYTSLQDAAWRKVGLRLRPEKCSVACFGTTDDADAIVPELQDVPVVTGTSCIRLLGDHVQAGGGFATEFALRREAAWKAWHLRKKFWKQPKALGIKLRMQHMVVFPTLSWCAGCRP